MMLAMGSPAPFGVVEIRAEHDVATELQLSAPKIKMLEFLAAHGGEIPFSWDSFAARLRCAANPAEAAAVTESREALVDLINTRLVTEREYVTSALQVQGRLCLRLTDRGRSVVAEHQKFRFVPGSVQPIDASAAALCRSLTQEEDKTL
jgi:hypothetical protein